MIEKLIRHWSWVPDVLHMFIFQDHPAIGMRPYSYPRNARKYIQRNSSGCVYMWNGVHIVVHVHMCMDVWGWHQGFPSVALHSMCWSESLNLEFAFLSSLAARSLGISSLILPSGITGRLPYLPGFFLWVLGIQAPASFLAGKGFAYRVTALVLKEPLTSGHHLRYKSLAPEMLAFRADFWDSKNAYFFDFISICNCFPDSVI